MTDDYTDDVELPRGIGLQSPGVAKVLGHPSESEIAAARSGRSQAREGNDNARNGRRVRGPRPTPGFWQDERARRVLLSDPVKGKPFRDAGWTVGPDHVARRGPASVSHVREGLAATPRHLARREDGSTRSFPDPAAALSWAQGGPTHD